MALTTLVPLGTNGFFASHSRLTMSFLILGSDGPGPEAIGKTALLLDAGSGVGRLVESEVRGLLKNVEHLDVVLTHYHLDHVVGLPALPAALATATATKGPTGRPPTVSLHVPAPPLVDCEPQEALRLLLEPPLFPSTMEETLQHISVRPYSSSQDLAQLLSTTSVALRRQTHPGGSVGLRFGNQLAYITDTCASEETIDFVRGVDWLLHEGWVTHQQARFEPATVAGHTDFRSLRLLAESATVRKLMPVHHHPTHTDAELSELHQELVSDQYDLVQGVEGGRYDLDISKLASVES